MIRNSDTLERARLETAPAAQQRYLLRIGGACAVAGALLFAISFAGHGDLPTHVSHVAALQFIANRGNWLLMHLGTILAGLLWVFALAALTGTLASARARAVGHLLLPSAVIGGLFIIFDYAIDGYAFKVLADDWAAASGARQAALQQTFDTLLALGAGTFRAELLLFYGVTILLAGLAVAFDGGYPVWFGGLGTAAGAVALVFGLASFLGLSFRVDFLVFVLVLPLEGLWLLVLGILMWRRSGLSVS